MLSILKVFQKSQLDLNSNKKNLGMILVLAYN